MDETFYCQPNSPVCSGVAFALHSIGCFVKILQDQHVHKPLKHQVHPSFLKISKTRYIRYIHNFQNNFLITCGISAPELSWGNHRSPWTSCRQLQHTVGSSADTLTGLAVAVPQCGMGMMASAMSKEGMTYEMTLGQTTRDIKLRMRA